MTNKGQVSKGKGSAMENTGNIRQDFDTGSKPGDPAGWRYRKLKVLRE